MAKAQLAVRCITTTAGFVVNQPPQKHKRNLSIFGLCECIRISSFPTLRIHLLFSGVSLIVKSLRPRLYFRMHVYMYSCREHLSSPVGGCFPHMRRRIVACGAGKSERTQQISNMLMSAHSLNLHPYHMNVCALIV